MRHLLASPQTKNIITSMTPYRISQSAYMILVDLDNVATDIAMGAAMYRSCSSAESANSIDGTSHESGPPATPGNRVSIA